jgi:molybdopterin synthase sulfur carrier subunit
VTQILYFAWLREKIGLAEETVTVPETVATVGGLVDWLAARGTNYAAAFAQKKLVRCAVDQDFAGAETAIAGAREIAFFPPVTGG